jgi:polysaccharide export outer membrane protein
MIIANKNRFLTKTVVYFFFLALLFAGTGCVSTKKILYFPTLGNSTLSSSNSAPESIIQNNDLLSISVSSLSAEASSVFNVPNISGASSGSTNGTGYLVNNSGDIHFPVIGSTKASGLTKDQLKANITKELSDRKLLVDPVVNIRYLNFRVTVLGEVGKPSVINVPSEKISLLEAIGLAGDITIYGKRNNVLLIREEGNQKITRRLNLNSDSLFSSGYYYLKSNDVVYVEPGKAKLSSTNRSAQWLPIIASGLTIGIILVDRLSN